MSKPTSGRTIAEIMRRTGEDRETAALIRDLESGKRPLGDVITDTIAGKKPRAKTPKKEPKPR